VVGSYCSHRAIKQHISLCLITTGIIAGLVGCSLCRVAVPWVADSRVTCGISVTNSVTQHKASLQRR
jgi:ammonia channel protein AmtB